VGPCRCWCKSNLRNACAAGPGLGDMGYLVSVLVPTENDETGRPQMEWLHRKASSSHRELVKRDSPAVLRPLGRDSWVKVFGRWPVTYRIERAWIGFKVGDWILRVDDEAQGPLAWFPGRGGAGIAGIGPGCNQESPVDRAPPTSRRKQPGRHAWGPATVRLSDGGKGGVKSR
jgi:hypothetical protein